MNSLNSVERTALLQQLGASVERVRQLEQQVAGQRQDWEPDAREWKRFQRHKSDLGEWLVDAATNEAGQLVNSKIDASLGGDLCVPCTFFFAANGKRYHIALVSTYYEVKET